MVYVLPSEVYADCTGFLYCTSLWASEVTLGWFWVLVLMGFGTIIFLATQRFQTPRSFGFASTFTMLGSVWLVTMNLIDWWIASIFILVGAAGFAVMIISEK